MQSVGSIEVGPADDNGTWHDRHLGVRKDKRRRLNPRSSAGWSNGEEEGLFEAREKRLAPSARLPSSLSGVASEVQYGPDPDLLAQ
jgi:hypothetical protein